MTKTALAWMPIYIGDYLGDTARLTTEQHGAYILLIMDYWRNGPPPDNDAILQQITKMEKPAWRKCRLALAGMFQISDGVWRHKRIDQELAVAEANADRRSEKAKSAANARWSKNAASNATSMPRAMLGECPPPSPAKANALADAREPKSEFEQRCRSLAQVIKLTRPIAEIDRAQLRLWLDEGLDFNWHILEGAKHVAARCDARGQAVRSFKYLDGGIREYHAEWLAERARYLGCTA